MGLTLSVLRTFVVFKVIVSVTEIPSISIDSIRRKGHAEFDLAVLVLVPILRVPGTLYAGLSKETWEIR